METYRDYLDEKHQNLFDDWRGSCRNPQQKHIGIKIGSSSWTLPAARGKV